MTLYPFLLVAARVLYLAANNPGQFSMGDLLLVLGFALSATMAVFGLAAFLIRFWRDGSLAALVTFIVVAWVFGAPALPQPWRPPSPGVWVAGIGASALLILALASRASALRIGAKFLTYTYGILVLWLAGDVAVDYRREREQVAASALVRDLSRPIEAGVAAGAPARSIYVIVLDEYANSATLREVLGYDNGALEDSLRALGFVVPRITRSNYAQTSLSLASLLNAAHVYPIGRELPRGARSGTGTRRATCRSCNA